MLGKKQSNEVAQMCLTVGYGLGWYGMGCVYVTSNLHFVCMYTLPFLVIDYKGPSLPTPTTTSFLPFLPSFLPSIFSPQKQSLSLRWNGLRACEHASLLQHPPSRSIRHLISFHLIAKRKQTNTFSSHPRYNPQPAGISGVSLCSSISISVSVWREKWCRSSKWEGLDCVDVCM